jgi:serpin B
MALLMLVNAVYFKGRWKDVFDPKLTRDETFHLAGGGETRVRMMSQKGEYAYVHGPGYQAICLPYGEGRTEMVIILPEDVKGLDSLIRDLDVLHWREILKAMRGQEGTIELPRFRIDYQALLNGALKDQGLGVAFNSAQADFSGIFTPTRDVNFAISDVCQKALLEVNEEGAVAAAATLMMPAADVMPVNPPPPFVMVVDHPFLCAIRDSLTGEILFIGAIRKP